MAQRIYTRTGDTGTTGLPGGVRLPKAAPRIEAFGCIDELNCVLGEAACRCGDPDLGSLIEWLQHLLFELGAEVAMAPGAPADAPATRGAAHLLRLEAEIDRLQEELPPLASFILPGGEPLAAALHVARAVCRRAERVLTALALHEPVGDSVPGVMNRLSDLLFVMARAANARAGLGDVPWNGGPR